MSTIDRMANIWRTSRPFAWLLILVTASILITSALTGAVGREPNRLDEMAATLKQAGFTKLEFAALWLSANLLHSSTANMRMGDRLTDQFQTESALHYYFPAVFRFPSLGLDAGKQTLKYATTDEDMNLAANYLESAAILADSAEAYRILGHLILTASWKPACKKWLRAFHYFEEGAKRGDAYAQLIVALAYIGDTGIPKSYKGFLANMILAERSYIKSVATIATQALARFPDTFPLTTGKTSRQNRYLSEKEARALLRDALNLGMQNFDYLKYRSDLHPEFCKARPIQKCNPPQWQCANNNLSILYRISWTNGSSHFDKAKL